LGRSDLVAICTDNKGMIQPNGFNIYATVRRDGVMKYLDIAGGLESIKQEKLQQDQLEVIRALLTNPELETFGGVVRTADGMPLVDFHSRLELSFTSSGRKRRISLEDFYPPTGRSYPESISAILCALDRFKVSQYKISRGCK
jgi:hypothetical protein